MNLGTRRARADRTTAGCRSCPGLATTKAAKRVSPAASVVETTVAAATSGSEVSSDSTWTGWTRLPATLTPVPEGAAVALDDDLAHDAVTERPTLCVGDEDPRSR